MDLSVKKSDSMLLIQNRNCNKSIKRTHYSLASTNVRKI